MIRDTIPLTFVLPATIVASGQSAPLGDLKGTLDLWIVLTVAPTFSPSSTTQQLDVYLQTSIDQGATWTDLAHSQFVRNVGATKLIKIRGGQAGRQNPFAPSVAQLPLNTVIQGPFGDYLRLQWVVSGSPIFGFPLLAFGVAK